MKQGIENEQDIQECYKILEKCHNKNTAQKMKFSIKDFFSKRDQSRRKLRMWSHLLKK